MAWNTALISTLYGEKRNAWDVAFNTLEHEEQNVLTKVDNGGRHTTFALLQDVRSRLEDAVLLGRKTDIFSGEVILRDVLDKIILATLEIDRLAKDYEFNQARLPLEACYHILKKDDAYSNHHNQLSIVVLTLEVVVLHAKLQINQSNSVKATKISNIPSIVFFNVLRLLKNHIVVSTTWTSESFNWFPDFASYDNSSKTPESPGTQMDLINSTRSHLQAVSLEVVPLYHPPHDKFDLFEVIDNCKYSSMQSWFGPELQAISPPSMSAVVDRWHPCISGTWLAQSASSVLHVKGAAGSGKTKLCADIFHTWHKDRTDLPHFAAFFCQEYAVLHEPLTAAKVMSSIVWQLINHPNLGHCVHTSAIVRWDACIQSRLDLRVSDALRLADCRHIILEMLEFDPAFIVIDGIDDMDEAETQKLLETLGKLTKSSQNVLKVLVTSHGTSITKFDIPALAETKLDVSDSELKRFAADKIEDLVSKVPYIAASKDKLLATLVAESKGSFVWIELQLLRLQSCPENSIDAFVNTIHDATLSQAYRAIYNEILSSPDRSIAIATICWMLYAYTPLDADTLYDAIKHFADVKDCSTEQIHAACRGLVKLDPEGLPSFMHTSARSFLQQQFWLAPKTALPKLAHTVLYICSGQSPRAGPGLIEYTNKYWAHHCYSAEEYDSPILNKSLTALLRRSPSQPSHDCCLAIARNIGMITPETTSYSPFLLAAALGFNSFLQSNIWTVEDLQQTTPAKETALHLACEAGHTSIVDLLLQLGLRGDALTQKGHSPLLLSSRGGHIDICKLLLSHDNATGSFVLDSFLASCEAGHEDVALFLLKSCPASQLMSASVYNATVQCHSKDVIKQLLRLTKSSQCTSPGLDGFAAAEMEVRSSPSDLQLIAMQYSASIGSWLGIKNLRTKRNKDRSYSNDSASITDTAAAAGHMRLLRILIAEEQKSGGSLTYTPILKAAFQLPMSKLALRMQRHILACTTKARCMNGLDHALEMAVVEGQTDLAKYCIEHGAYFDPAAFSTAYHQGNHEKLCQILDYYSSLHGPIMGYNETIATTVDAEMLDELTSLSRSLQHDSLYNGKLVTGYIAQDRNPNRLTTWARQPTSLNYAVQTARMETETKNSHYIQDFDWAVTENMQNIWPRHQYPEQKGWIAVPLRENEHPDESDTTSSNEDAENPKSTTEADELDQAVRKMLQTCRQLQGYGSYHEQPPYKNDKLVMYDPTEFVLCAALGNAELIKFICKHNDIFGTSTFTQRVALVEAARAGQTVVVEVLLALTVQDPRNIREALRTAVVEDHTSTIEHLRKDDLAFWNDQQFMGDLFLYSKDRTSYGFRKATEWFETLSSAVRDKVMYRLLMEAVDVNSVPAVDFVLEKQAILDTEFLVNAFLTACQCENFEVATLLFSRLEEMTDTETMLDSHIQNLIHQDKWRAAIGTMRYQVRPNKTHIKALLNHAIKLPDQHRLCSILDDCYVCRCDRSEILNEALLVAIDYRSTESCRTLLSAGAKIVLTELEDDSLIGHRPSLRPVYALIARMAAVQSYIGTDEWLKCANLLTELVTSGMKIDSSIATSFLQQLGCQCPPIFMHFLIQAGATVTFDLVEASLERGYDAFGFMAILLQHNLHLIADIKARETLLQRAVILLSRKLDMLSNIPQWDAQVLDELVDGLSSTPGKPSLEMSQRQHIAYEMNEIAWYFLRHMLLPSYVDSSQPSDDNPFSNLYKKDAGFEADNYSFLRPLIGKKICFKQLGIKLEPLLLAAAYQRSHCRMILLLTQGVDVNYQNKLGVSALHLVAEAGEFDLCVMLLQAGAEVDIKNKDGQTPLSLVKAEHRSISELLQRHGARYDMLFDVKDMRTVLAGGIELPADLISKLDLESEDGRLVFVHACRDWSDATFEQLLVRCHGRNIVNKLNSDFARNVEELSPLHAVVAGSRYGRIRALMDLGADPTAKSGTWPDAITFAVLHDKFEALTSSAAAVVPNGKPRHELEYLALENFIRETVPKGVPPPPDTGNHSKAKKTNKKKKTPDTSAYHKSFGPISMPTTLDPYKPCLDTRLLDTPCDALYKQDALRAAVHAALASSNLYMLQIFIDAAACSDVELPYDGETLKLLFTTRRERNDRNGLEQYLARLRSHVGKEIEDGFCRLPESLLRYCKSELMIWLRYIRCSQGLFSYACKQGDLEILEIGILDGHNKIDIYGDLPPVHIAAAHGQFEAVKLLSKNMHESMCQHTEFVTPIRTAIEGCILPKLIKMRKLDEEGKAYASRLAGHSWSKIMPSTGPLLNYSHIKNAEKIVDYFLNQGYSPLTDAGPYGTAISMLVDTGMDRYFPLLMEKAKNWTGEDSTTTEKDIIVIKDDATEELTVEQDWDHMSESSCEA